MEWGETIERSAVWIRFPVKEELCHAHMTAMRRHVKGSQVVYRNLEFSQCRFFLFW